MSQYAEELKRIEQLPQTWLPAILLFMIGECKKRKVFASDEAMKAFVTRAIEASPEESEAARWMAYLRQKSDKDKAQ